MRAVFLHFFRVCRHSLPNPNNAVWGNSGFFRRPFAFRKPNASTPCNNVSPMRKTKAEAQKTREQLLQSALDTFLENGVSRTSLAAIARNAGVTRGALYWHFKNKEDLFEALFQQIFADCGTSFAACLEQPDRRSLRRMFVDIFDHIQHNALHRRLIILHTKCEFTEETRPIMAAHQKYIGLWEQQLRRILETCTDGGELPADLDINLAVHYLHAVTCGLIDMWVYEQQTNLAALVPPIIDAAIHTLQHSPALRQAV